MAEAIQATIFCAKLLAVLVVSVYIFAKLDEAAYFNNWPVLLDLFAKSLIILSVVFFTVLIVTGG